MKYLKYYKDVIIVNDFYIPDDIKIISNIFINNGYDIFIVGGAIRDYLLNQKPHDYDLVTNAQPNKIKELLNNYKLDLQGQHFAVIRVYTENFQEGIEIASYRKDISNGRDNKKTNKPKVEYGHHITIKDDVLRRDLTCNALYYNIRTKKIVDLVGGINDIKNNIIRSVGNPINRFKEDRLRILRTFRFASKTNSLIDKKTSDAIKYDNRLNGISNEEDISQERIMKEFYDMLNWSISNNNMSSWLNYLNLLKKFKMFVRMFPNIHISTKFYKTFNDIIILSNLFINNIITDDFHNKLFNFKLSNRVINGIIYLIKIKKLLNKENIHDLYDHNSKNNIYNLFLKKIDIHLNNETIGEFLYIHKINYKYINMFLKYKITTISKEVINMGFKGKEIGEQIRYIECQKFKKDLYLI